MAIADATPEEIARDVELACDAGLDLLRIHAHITRPELYDAADEAGLLLWQDLPLQRGYARGIRKQAVQQATAAVDLLGHHPSIAIWCGHNEPMAIDSDPARRGDPKVLRRLAVKAAAAGAPDVEQDGARPIREASAGEGGRHPPGDRPQRRPPAPAPARRHRQPPLLRLVPRPRARPPRVPTGHAPDGPVRLGVRRTGGAGERGVLRAGALAGSRLGPPRSHPRPAATAVRPARGSRRPCDLRRVARRHPGLPSRGGAATHRGTAPHQVPADGRVRPVLLRRRAPCGHVVRARPRPGPEGGVRRAARGLPAGDRRRRPVAGAGDRRPGPRPGRARGERPAHPGRRRPGHRRAGVERRQPHLAAGAATSPPTGASGSARCRWSCPTRPDRSRWCSDATTRAGWWTTGTRRRSPADSRGSAGQE